MRTRIITTILILLSVFFLPYWIYVPALVLFSVLFPLYIEAIVLAFLIDVLYGGRALFPLSFQYPFAIGFSLVLIMLLPLRSKLRNYA